MNAELLERATAAILGEGYVPPELAREHAEAVLRVAIEVCAEMCHQERMDLFRRRDTTTDQKVYRAEANAINLCEAKIYALLSE